MALRSHRSLLSLLVVALLGAGCTGGSQDEETAGQPEADPGVVVGPDGYGAVITRTADGVPHIRAQDLEGVLFGQGWASAEDHPCDLVDQILKVHSLRAATFGPGEDDANVSSDFGWRVLGVADRAQLDWERESSTARSIVESFVAGWNAQIETIGDEGVDDWCRDAGWMRTITAEELYAYSRSVPLLASGARLAGFVATARPPGDPGATTTTEAALSSQPRRDRGEATASEAAAVDGSGLASNGWAIGSERSAAGGGMVLGNPHFPWIGELRFWEVHLSTDDGLDVYGAQLLGLPLVGIGFTEGMAWTHTVSAGRRFTAYQMQLDPADPTRYLFDGQSVPMTPHEITVEVRAEDGSTSPITRTYWSTQFGPVIDFPGVGWTEEVTVSYRDANFDNADFIEMYLDIDRAGSLDDLIAAQEEYQAVPLFNTVAAGADGRTWYADTAVTPYLSEEALAAYQQRLDAGGLTKLAQASNAVLLEGNTSRDVWVDDPEAPWSGVLPWSKLPMIERTDYVMNANDSYWVPNATAFIDGEFSPLQGLAGTARSVRTRQNLAVLDDRSPSGPSGEDGRFTLDELAGAALLDGAYTEVQWREGVVERCRTATATVTSPDLLDRGGAVVVPSRTVDLPASGACEVLAAWDGLYDVDSRGAVLWREAVARIDNATAWATPFDPARPATTPSGLAGRSAEGPDPFLTALASSVALLDHAGVPLDVALGEVQYDARQPEEHLAVPGGLGQEGITNVVTHVPTAAGTLQEQPDLPQPLVKGSTLTGVGYPINYGTSFLMAVELTEDGPRARTLLTYGETGDPGLAGFSSQMVDFAQKRWKTVRFTRADIAADPDATVTEVAG
jgi:acyl-homoserine-lactone acylase